MILYLAIIGIGLGLIFTINMVLSYFSVVPFGIGYAFFATLFYFLIQFGLDAIIALAVRFSPKKWFDPRLKIYKVASKEKYLYQKIGIKGWKDKIPELGKIAHFSKTKIESNETTYLLKFASETCYAEVMHVLSIIFTFLPVIFAPTEARFTFAFPIAVINLFLQIPPVLVQRYNRPKLLILYERSLRQNKNA